MKKKIYISGKITGLENSKELFSNAESKLKEMGFEVINPMKLPHNHDKSWQSYMREDIKFLCDCDYIYMLANWQESRGANLEYKIAICLGIVCLEQEPTVGRDELIERIEEIQNKINATGFLGANEYDLHLREELADLFFNLLNGNKLTN